MKKLIEDVSGEGFDALMGEKVTLFCVNYFYTGKLVGANDEYVKLADPAIVYETGAWTDVSYADVQALPTPALYVKTALVEAFGVLK